MNGWMVFEIAINAFQAILMVYFVRHRFHIVKTNIRYGVVTGLAICIYLSAYLFFEIPFLDTYVFLFPLLYTFFVSDDKWYVKLFWNVVLTAVFISVTNLMINIYLQLAEATWAQIMAETPLRASFVVSCNTAILCAVFILTRVSKQRDALSKLALFVFLVMIVIQLFVIELLYSIRVHVNSDDVLFTTASISMLGCAGLSLLLFEIMSASAEKQRMYEAELETAKMTQHHSEEIKDMYTYMVSHQHDIKHQLQIVQRMIADGHVQEGNAYFQELTVPSEFTCEFMTGCVAVDALLTVKKLAMDKNQIQFIFQPYPLHSLPIAESKFCALLANLLDNAIEAVLRIDAVNQGRTITFKLARSWDIFFITCENPMSPSSIRMNGARFISSKPDHAHHGFGTRNINSIVNEANGQCRFAVKDTSFRVEITLPYGKEQEK